MARRVCTLAALALTLAACSDAAPPPASVVRDLLEATRAYVIQDLALSEAGDELLNAGTANFLDAMSTALEGVHDAATAAAARPELEILADRLDDLLPQRLRLELPPVQARRAALAELASWRTFEGHMQRLETNPQAAEQLREPLQELISSFERRQTSG